MNMHLKPAEGMDLSQIDKVFTAYDVRGLVGVDLNEAVAERIGYAIASELGLRRVVVGRDCRHTSPILAAALAHGLMAAGVHVLDIGMAGTEEVYFATEALGADGGVVVTASHNPIEYNGFKFIGEHCRPLTEREFDALRRASAHRMPATTARGRISQVDMRADYARKVLQFVDAANINPLRVVVDAGNGVAGAAFDAINRELRARGVELEVMRINHAPDPEFGNGVPNPLLAHKRALTRRAVFAHRADLGIAWDGDFDRCFFFDDTGKFIEGHVVVALLTQAFLQSHPRSAIVHDSRVNWAARDMVARHDGRASVSKVGHSFVKRLMHESSAIYGGEISGHHYFRDFMGCDSGMIPWLKVIEMLSVSAEPLSEMAGSLRAVHPASEEINFRIADPAKALTRIYQLMVSKGIKADWFDGLSLEHKMWRLNIRASNTEPLLRLNVETRGDPDLLSEIENYVSAMLFDAGAERLC